MRYARLHTATHGYARFFQKKLDATHDFFKKKLKCFSTNTTYNSFILLRTNDTIQ